MEFIKTWGPVVAVGLAFSLGAIKDLVLYWKNTGRAKAILDQIEADLQLLVSTPQGGRYDVFKDRELTARSAAALGEKCSTIIYQYGSPTQIRKFEKTLRLIYHFRDSCKKIESESHVQGWKSRLPEELDKLIKSVNTRFEHSLSSKTDQISSGR